MVFHEITPSAIAAAVADPREIDDQLVDAQETRRILDRLYGYEVSPVLWKKVLPRLSAGRVQSVATRMVVERERARMAFHTAEYWDVEATFAPVERKPNDPETFTATLGQRRRPAPGHRPRLRPGDRTRTARRCCTWTRPARAGWPPGSTAASSPSRASRRSRTAAVRTRRS